jgi:O-antigen/teichoic acid export membrane protein
MDTAFFRFGSRDGNLEKAFSTAILPILFTTIFFVIVLLFFAQPIAEFLKYPEQAHYVRWFAFILGFDTLVALPYARLRLKSRPMKFLFFRVTNVIVTVLLVLFFLELCPLLMNNGFDWVSKIYDPEVSLDYVFLSNLIASGIIFLMMLPDIFKIKLKFDFALWKKMVLYSLPLVVVGIAGSINQAFAVPLQKYFLGSDFNANLNIAGIYAGPAKLALLLNLFIIAFNYAAEPFFFNHFQNTDAKAIYGKVANAFTIVACFVVLGILMYMDLIQYIIGPNYREAIHIVPILLFAYLFLGLYYNFSIWYKLVDKTGFGALISIIGAIITLVISIYYLPKIGYIASAWAAFSCYLFMSLAAVVIGRKYYPIQYPFLRIVLYILLTAGIYFTSTIYRDQISSIPIKLLVNSGLLLVFVGVIIYFEKSIIKEIIRPKKKT